MLREMVQKGCIALGWAAEDVCCAALTIIAVSRADKDPILCTAGEKWQLG